MFRARPRQKYQDQTARFERSINAPRHTDRYEVEIRRTSYGIPHITAKDYGSLAFGVAYAYAEDNLCLIADAVLTTRGERSRFLGASATVSVGGADLSNLDSDFFFKFYFGGEDLAESYQRARPLTAAMAEGYAAGLNLYLDDRGLDRLPPSYREAFSAVPVTASDFYRLITQKASQTAGEAFARAMLNAQPPSDDRTKGAASACEAGDSNLTVFSSTLGSNAFAFGQDLTERGCGILVANPHFPWFGHKRFYQMHLIIPGELDVMGAALPPLPVINIGFNDDVAWTHTVSNSRTFAIYELTLSPHSPRQFVIDGKAEAMDEVEVIVNVLEPDGSLSKARRLFYRTRFGPVIAMPELGCLWTKKRAFALYDIARPKLGFVEQWLWINKARSVREVEAALAEERGAPWLNTLAADKHGDVFYGNFSATPSTDWAARYWRCAPSWRALIAGIALNIVVLDGSKSKCDLRSDAKPGSGILPENQMPSVVRRDYVLNCNDSHWLVNLSAPLEGYSPLIGKERTAQGLRTRMAYKQVTELISRKNKLISIEDAKELALSNRNLAAELILDQLPRHCACRVSIPSPDGRTVDVDLVPACEILTDWDRRDELNSRGAVLFREFWRKAQTIRRLWKKRFNARMPATTPVELNTGSPKVIEKLRVALAETVIQFQSMQLELDVTLAKVQRYPTKNGAIGVPGGRGDAGVLNQVLFDPLTPGGYAADRVIGTSYTQVVSWIGNAPVAAAILPFSQSSDPDSPHYADQMELFARKEWVRLPFAEEDIMSDPNMCSILLQSNKKAGNTEFEC